MSTDLLAAPPARGARLAVAIAGIVAIALGICILVWPGRTAVVVTALVAGYAIVTGVVYAVTGIFSKGLGAGGRIGHVLLGLLFIVAGAFAFSQLQTSAAFLALFVTVMLGAMWIIEGFVSLFTLGRGGSGFATVVFAVLSIVAGFVLVLSPLWSAVFLWWFAGIALIVLGVLNVGRAIIGRRATPAAPAV